MSETSEPTTRATAATVEHDCAASGHLYDDDWPWPEQAVWRALAPGSSVGDPCIWCDHDKGADE
jgi:hypothetical protein